MASYRLAVHLGLAFVILGILAWYILLLGRSEADLMQARRAGQLARTDVEAHAARTAVEAAGGRIELVPLRAGASTTRLVERMRGGGDEGPVRKRPLRPDDDPPETTKNG